MSLVTWDWRQNMYNFVYNVVSRWSVFWETGEIEDEKKETRVVSSF